MAMDNAGKVASVRRVPMIAIVGLVLLAISFCFLAYSFARPATIYHYYQSLQYPETLRDEREVRIQIWLMAGIAQTNVEVGDRVLIFGHQCRVRLGARLSLVKMVGETVIADHRNDTMPPPQEFSEDFPNCPETRVSLSLWEWDRIIWGYERHLKDMEEQQAIQDAVGNQ